MIKHFGVWPHGVNKDDLFDVQKTFLIYLMGNIPNYDEWSTQIDYQNKFNAIKQIDRVDIDESDIDLAKLQGRSLQELKRERLALHKKDKIAELNKSFGITVEDSNPDKVKKISETVNKSGNRDKLLWDLVNGKNVEGLTEE